MHFQHNQCVSGWIQLLMTWFQPLGVVVFSGSRSSDAHCLKMKDAAPGKPWRQKVRDKPLRKKNIFSTVGWSITTLHYSSVNLAVRQQSTDKRERYEDEGRERESARESERKWWARQMQTICRACAGLIEKQRSEKWRATAEEEMCRGGEEKTTQGELMRIWCQETKTKRS